MSVLLIDIAPLVQGADEDAATRRVADELGRACVEHGFGTCHRARVDGALIERLLSACHEFCLRSAERKQNSRCICGTAVAPGVAIFRRRKS